MSHLDPDQLALIALGEPVASDQELEHLATCEQCSAELAELKRTVDVARATIGDSGLESPPAHVWAGIAAELQLAESPAPAAPSATEPPRTPPPRRRRRALWALAAVAALVVLAGAGLGAWLISVQLAPQPIAAATLDSFPAHPGAVGTADVEEGRNGSRTLLVTLEAGTVPDTYREVWLIRADAGALISLGVLKGERGSFPIPDGVDLSEYRLVDISVEPVDGDPAHSGDSIVRGELDFA